MVKTERLDYQQAIRDLLNSEEQFREIFSAAPIGMAVIHISGWFTQVNTALCNLTGYSSAKLTRLRLCELMPTEDSSRLLSCTELLAHNNERLQMLEVKLSHVNGTFIPVMIYLALVRGGDDQPLFYISQFIDMTERKQYEENICHLAYHDYLTGLPNRMQFRDRLTVAITQARANNEMLAVIFLDLDRFKEINDTLGHNAGDEVLKVIAGRLRGSLRQSDVVARLGGDEFILLMPGIQCKKSVDLVIEKIISAIEQPLIVQEQEFVVSASVGVAIFPDMAMEIDDLLEAADKNMYAVKQSKSVEK